MPNPEDYKFLDWAHPNPEYIKLRESLIPEAMEWTNKLCGKRYQGESKKEKTAWDARWSREFLKRVGFLYEETVNELNRS